MKISYRPSGRPRSEWMSLAVFNTANMAFLAGNAMRAGHWTWFWIDFTVMVISAVVYVCCLRTLEYEKKVEL